MINRMYGLAKGGGGIFEHYKVECHFRRKSDVNRRSIDCMESLKREIFI